MVYHLNLVRLMDYFRRTLDYLRRSIPQFQNLLIPRAQDVAQPVHLCMVHDRLRFHDYLLLHWAVLEMMDLLLSLM